MPHDADFFTPDPNGELLHKFESSPAIELAKVHNSWLHVRQSGLDNLFNGFLSQYVWDGISLHFANKQRQSFIIGSVVAIEAAWLGKFDQRKLPFYSIMNNFKHKLQNPLSIDHIEDRVTDLLAEPAFPLISLEKALSRHIRDTHEKDYFELDVSNGFVWTTDAFAASYASMHELSSLLNTDVDEEWASFSSETKFNSDQNSDPDNE